MITSAPRRRGRPVGSGKPPAARLSVTLSVHLTIEEADRIIHEAAREEMSVSELLRRTALRSFLSSRKVPLSETVIA